MPIEELLRAGGKMKGKLPRGSFQPLIDTHVCKVLGVVADLPTHELRRQCLEKARRLLTTR